MKPLRKCAERVMMLAGIFGLALLLTGCHTNEPVFADLPGTPASGHMPGAVFQPGDLINITFVGGGVDIPAHTENIKDDGTITPPYVGSVVAAGKTPGKLQKELQEKYDKLYNHLTVTVRTDSQLFYISGEVRSPGPKVYPGDMDVIKAISAAGDFTDFAKKTRVQITRANGKKETVNYFEILADPKKDRPIYPGDKIFVPRRLL